MNRGRPCFCYFGSSVAGPGGAPARAFVGRGGGRRYARPTERTGASLLLAVLVALLVMAGCGRQARPAGSDPGTANPTSERIADLPSLPDWAPENPSPEFLRAAQVLKPFPTEKLSGATAGDEARKALRLLWWPALYEFFGTLTDEQIKRFLSSQDKKILIPVKLLTAKQRAALDKWLDLYREANEGTGPPELQDMEDYRVVLYKLGAQEDLSNVEVGFVAKGGHSVHVLFCITRQDGSQDEVCTSFAQL